MLNKKEIIEKKRSGEAGGGCPLAEIRALVGQVMADSAPSIDAYEEGFSQALDLEGAQALGFVLGFRAALDREGPALLAYAQGLAAGFLDIERAALLGAPK